MKRLSAVLAESDSFGHLASELGIGDRVHWGLNIDEVWMHTGANAPSAQLVFNIAIVMLTIVVGLGGILDLAGRFLLFRKHSASGSFLVGLGGGSTILGLLFAIAVALHSTGLSSPIFQQSYFTLYWIGAVLATTSILFSLRGRNR